MSMSSCPAPFSLVQLTTGDLTAAQRAEVESHVEGCHGCKEKLASLCTNVEIYGQRQEAHLASLKSRLAVEKATEAARERRWGWKWIPTLAAPVAAAAVLLLIWLPGQHDQSGGGIRFKGALSAKVVAQRGGQQFVVKNGSQLTKDDALRFILTASSAGFVTVFSVDSQDRTTPFYPETDPVGDPTPLRMEKQGKHLLPGSIILDGSVGREQIVIVFSEREFRRDALHGRIVRLLKDPGTSAAISKRIGMPVIILTMRKVEAIR